MVLVLISGSAAVAMLAGVVGPVGILVQALIMLIPTVIGAVSAVWNLSDGARKHEALANRFYQIASSVNVREADPAVTDELYKRVLMIYAEEPPAVYHALSAICYNSATLARYHEPEYLFPVNSWHRLLRNWRRYSEDDFKLKRQIYDAR